MDQVKPEQSRAQERAPSQREAAAPDLALVRAQRHLRLVPKALRYSRPENDGKPVA